MTREEHIREVAQQYAEDLLKIRGVERYDGHDIIQVAKDFVEWADEHPKERYNHETNNL